MRNKKRRPITVGRVLLSEYLEPAGIGKNQLADAMGVHRNSLNRIVNDKGVLRAPMAIKLATAIGNTPEFWLNIQHAVELWDVRHKAYAKEAKGVKKLDVTTRGEATVS